MGKPGPGPGDYDVYDPVKLEVQHMNTKTSDKRPELQVPRYPDSMLKTAAKDVIINGVFILNLFENLGRSWSWSIFNKT